MPRANNSKKPVVDDIDALERDLVQRADACIRFVKGQGTPFQKGERFEELRGILNEFYEYEDQGYSLDQNFIDKLAKFDSSKPTVLLKKKLGIAALNPLEKNKRKTNDAESDRDMSDENFENIDLALAFMKAKTKEELGELLKSTREDAGMTQIEVAKKMGIDDSAVRKMEGGKVSSSWERVQSYISALGIEI